MATLLFNGVAVATPNKFEVSVMDVDGDTSRNANGDMVRDRITTKRKISCAWPALTNAQISQILNAVSGVFFSISYPDPQAGGQITKTFYVGDRTAPAYSFRTDLPPWEGLSMNFIEK